MGEIMAHQRAAADSTCSFIPEAADRGLYSVNGVRQQLQLQTHTDNWNNVSGPFANKKEMDIPYVHLHQWSFIKAQSISRQ